ncbi:hypothetical protein PFISCL1PPCAC_27189, partial [Pristionchus fissidentatus]
SVYDEAVEPFYAIAPQWTIIQKIDKREEIEEKMKIWEKRTVKPSVHADDISQLIVNINIPNYAPGHVNRCEIPPAKGGSAVLVPFFFDRLKQQQQAQDLRRSGIECTAVKNAVPEGMMKIPVICFGRGGGTFAVTYADALAYKRTPAADSLILPPHDVSVDDKNNADVYCTLERINNIAAWLFLSTTEHRLCSNVFDVCEPDPEDFDEDLEDITVEMKDLQGLVSSPRRYEWDMTPLPMFEAKALWHMAVGEKVFSNYKNEIAEKHYQDFTLGLIEVARMSRANASRLIIDVVNHLADCRPYRPSTDVLLIPVTPDDAVQSAAFRRMLTEHPEQVWDAFLPAAQEVAHVIIANRFSTLAHCIATIYATVRREEVPVFPDLTPEQTPSPQPSLKRRRDESQTVVTDQSTSVINVAEPPAKLGLIAVAE